MNPEPKMQAGACPAGTRDIARDDANGNSL